MSDGIHPTGPAQPTLNQVYSTPGNPATKEPAEKAQASENAAAAQDEPVYRRCPQEQAPYMEDATPTSVAYGIRGAPPGEEAKGFTEEDYGKHTELDAAQMAAPGEGKIYNAVQEKPGADGAQPGLETDLERKKAEQAPAREAIEAEKQKEVDVGGVLGQRGGPANPVDKDNYPNTGSVGQ